MTAEDPVEYNLFGINQVQVRTEIGMTFAAALKAFLRQDPNIIMVGEIRDLETGGIAIKAALTGPPGALHAAHQLGAGDASPVCSTWGSSRSTWPRRSTSSWRSASCAASARKLQDEVRARRRRARRAPRSRATTTLRELRFTERGAARRQGASASQGRRAVPREPLARHARRRAALLQGARAATPAPAPASRAVRGCTK